MSGSIYYMDGSAVGWKDLIRMADKEGFDWGGDTSCKSTSMAADFLRTKGHEISDMPPID